MILVTGANGKLGRALIATLSATHQVRGAARGLTDGNDGIAVGPLTGATDWTSALHGVDTVIHCAALTWIDPADPDQSEFQTVNVAATRALAEQAVEAGVRRIVYISSLTVSGKHSGARSFRHDDIPNPQSEYSRTKWMAEQALRAIEAKKGLEVAVVRPPRIIWPELSGNLALMAKLIRKGIPLPFGLLSRNRRDNVSADNLISALVLAATVKGAAGGTFLVSDKRPLSTRALTLWLGDIVGKAPILLPVPLWLLKWGMRIIPRGLIGKLNRDEMLDELSLNLEIDTDHSEQVLGWRPLDR